MIRITLVFLGFLAATILASAPVFAQCTGTSDLALVTLPTGDMVETFITPDCVELNGNDLAPPDGRVLGGLFVVTGPSNQLVLFTDAAPGIDVVFGAAITGYPVTGTTMLCGGVSTATVVDMSNNYSYYSEAHAITDVAVGSLSNTTYAENILPAPPVAVAGVGAANPDGSTATFALLVETSLPSVELHFGLTVTSFPIPGLLPGTSLAYSTGPVAGFVAFDATNAHHVAAGVLTTIPLGGTYLDVIITATGITVNLVGGGTKIIPLGDPVQVEPFGTCTAGGGIAYAVDLANPWVVAAGAAWAPPVLVAPAQPIPTLSEWGLIVLAIVFLTIGILTFRRRNRVASP